MIFLRDAQNKYTAVVDGDSCVFDDSHPNYKELIMALVDSDEEKFKELFCGADQILKWSEDNFSVEGGYLIYNGKKMDDFISSHVIGLIKQKVDYKPMLRFIENLYKNTSYQVIQRLYQFLSHKNLPITSDGCFLAYKAVTNKFLDKHTGTIDNSVGKNVKVDRCEVNDNMQVECSNGLHVGTLQYVEGFRNGDDNMIVCKVNPANVVAIPYADAHKLRCCEYDVVDLYKGPLDNYYNDSYDEDDEEEEDDECESCGDFWCDGDCEEDEDEEDEDEYNSFGW